MNQSFLLLAELLFAWLHFINQFLLDKSNSNCASDANKISNKFCVSDVKSVYNLTMDMSYLLEVLNGMLSVQE